MNASKMLKLQIRPRRTAVLAIALLVFVCLGFWKWIEMKSAPFSLFDWWGDALANLVPDVRRGPVWDMPFGFLILFIWTVVYVAISLGVGWLLAAIADAIRGLFRNESKPNKRSQATV